MKQRYTVIWKRSLIEKDLANYVVEAMAQGGDVQAITRAMAAIDRLLSDRPESQGESRADFERVLIVPPLTVTFEVQEEEHIAYILRARYSRPR